MVGSFFVGEMFELIFDIDKLSLVVGSFFVDEIYFVDGISFIEEI